MGTPVAKPTQFTEMSPFEPLIHRD